MIFKDSKDKFYGLSSSDLRIIDNPNDSNIEEIKSLQEKARKFVSYHNRNLFNVAKKRFKNNNPTKQIESIIELFFLKTEKTNLNSHILINTSIDPSLLNASLYCFDALKKFNSLKTNYFSKKIKNYKLNLLQSLREELGVVFICIFEPGVK